MHFRHTAVFVGYGVEVDELGGTETIYIVEVEVIVTDAEDEIQRKVCCKYFLSFGIVHLARAFVDLNEDAVGVKVHHADDRGVEHGLVAQCYRLGLLVPSQLLGDVLLRADDDHRTTVAVALEHGKAQHIVAHL